MSARRLWLVTQLDLAESLRGPLFTLFGLFMVWNGYLVSRGSWFLRSNSTSMGSFLAFVNSEFQIAYVCSLLGFSLLCFFVAISSGMPLIRDEERKVGEILHSTPLSAGEYVWGKFLAAVGATVAMIAVFILSTILFSHGLPDPELFAAYGPFSARIYLLPALVFLLPGTIFLAGACFALGRFTGRPVAVYLLPAALLVFFYGFFWSWRPPEHTEAVRTFYQFIDPSGFRWLRQTFLTVDRGISFYNHRPIEYAPWFLLSRALLVLLGLGLVDLSRRHFARRLRIAEKAGKKSGKALERPEPSTPLAAAAPSSPLAGLGMTTRPGGFLAGALAVARFELSELRAQPGLYVLIPVILIFQVIQLGTLRAGDQNIEVLLTSGVAAAEGLTTLTLWLCLLLLFFTVESLQRDAGTGAAGVVYSTPIRTSSLLAGKALANAAVVVVTLLAVVVSIWIVMRYQEGGVRLEAAPFFWVWGLLLVPTLVLWTAFVTAVFALTRSRYGTYGIGLLALAGTVVAYARDHVNWVGNWPLIGAVRWSDLGVFPLDREALTLSRLLALALAAFFFYVAVRRFGRRDRDRVYPALGRDGRRFVLTASALAAVPLALGIALWVLVNQGFQGGAVRERQEQYWRRNHATWTGDAGGPLPYVAHVEMDMDLEPAERWFRVKGFYDLQNRKNVEIPWFPVTGGTAWTGLSWTLNGRPFRPEDRFGLYVFRLARPLPPGGKLRLGFQYEGRLLPGVSRRGGELPLGEFILPAGGVVTGRNPDFVPVVKYDPEIGIDEDRHYEARVFPPGWYKGVTDSSIDRSAFTQRLRITAPAEYMVNSTGVQTSSSERGGRRTAVWESDYPLRVFNVALSRNWAVRRGKGTAIFYYPGHEYNVDSMAEALDGARSAYSEWFAPYPWRELRLNEFPSLATYARGNATNIFFSEGIGFLIKEVPGSEAAFAVTAHEAAHQWWGHIVAGAEGPGGIVLIEGAANYATLMLLERFRGFQGRAGEAMRMETRYGEYRQPDGEKPLAETLDIDTRFGDNTVVYDKGGWVFWMLMERMGREAFLAGVKDYFRTYHNNPDHPAIQDFVAVMRPYAPDKAAFDDFVRQWFYDIVMPEYQLSDAKKEKRGGEWEVVVQVKNVGTGRMPVDVAATAGERFAQGSEDGKPSPDYRDARVTLVLGAGESKEARIRCPFEPEMVVVDPDVEVLQLQRPAAIHRF